MRKKALQEKLAALVKENGEHVARVTAETFSGDSAAELVVIEAREKEIESLEKEIAAIEKLENKAKSNVASSARVEVHNNQEDAPFRHIGEQLQAVVTATVGGTVDPRLHRFAPTGASEGVPSDGGYFVQTDLSNDLLQRTFQSANLISRVSRVQISANSNGIRVNGLSDASRVDGSRGGGLLTYWATEAGTATAKKPTYRFISMDLQKLLGMYYATEELLTDASALSSIVSREFVKEFSFVFDNAIFRGSGVGQPLGFMNSPALVTIAKEAGQAADTIVTENVVKMYQAMPDANKGSAVWLVNSNCFAQLLTLSIGIGAAGYPVFLPPGGISGQPYGTLFGRPVVFCEQSASIGDLGDIAFVDLSEYLWIEKGGLQSSSSIHVSFLTGETAFRWVARVNGQPRPDKPTTPYKGVASSLSPFVTLAAR